MMKIFSAIYYACIVFIIYDNGSFFSHIGEARPQFIMFARIFKILNFDEAHISQIYLFTFLLTLLFSLSGLFYFNIYHRLANVSLLLVLFSLKFSFGKIGHSYHVWLISSVLFLFVNEQKKLTDPKNFFWLRLIQSTTLCPYFFSGLWKLRNLQPHNIFITAKELIAYSLAEGGGPNSFLRTFIFVNYEWLLSLGYIIVIFFQLSCIVPIILQRYIMAWGLMAILFHLFTGLFFNIWFEKTVLGVIVFFILLEKMISYEKKTLGDPEFVRGP